MASEKVETVVAGNYLEMEREDEDSNSARGKLSKFFWHGGSVYDAWFSCASNQALMTNHHISMFYYFLFCFVFMFSNYYTFCDMMNAGCTSVADVTIFFFPTGDVIWYFVSAFLWLDGKLDCLPHQHPLC